MKILTIVSIVVLILIVFKVDITLRPFRVTAALPGLNLAGFVVFVIGTGIMSYADRRDARKQGYVSACQDILGELEKLKAKERHTTDSCAACMDQAD